MALPVAQVAQVLHLAAQTGLSVSQTLRLPVFAPIVSAHSSLDPLRRLGVVAFGRAFMRTLADPSARRWMPRDPEAQALRLHIVLRAMQWARGDRGFTFPGGAARATCSTWEPRASLSGDEMLPLARMRSTPTKGRSYNRYGGKGAVEAISTATAEEQHDDLVALAAGGEAWVAHVTDVLSQNYAAAEAAIIPGHDRPYERRAVARLPAVVALTRMARRGEWGEPRGMIPGGEDEEAYLAAIAQGEADPDPVWSEGPVFVGETW